MKPKPTTIVYRAIVLTSLFGLLTAGLIGWYVSSIAGGRIGLGIAVCILLATAAGVVGGLVPLRHRARDEEAAPWRDSHR